MLREDCSSDKSLEDTEGAESKPRTKHREKAIKEGGWPANFRKEKHDNLEDDKQAVDDSPENAANLVGYGAVLNVFAVSQVLRCDIATLFGRFKRVDSFDVCDDDEDAAGEDQYKRHDAQEADNIESKENICSCADHCDSCERLLMSRS